MRIFHDSNMGQLYLVFNLSDKEEAEQVVGDLLKGGEDGGYDVTEPRKQLSSFLAQSETLQ